MKVRRLAWLGMRTESYRETKEFFGDVLGLKLVVEDPGVAVFQLPSGEHDFIEVLDVDDPDSAFMTTGPVPGLLVEDVVEARRELEAAGLEMLEPIRWWEFPGSDLPEIPGYGWFNFRGPDGNVYCCVQHRRGPHD